MKKLALVLSGGAAKGYAHIGVLKALENAGIKPDLIVGTSMGALVGGMYAIGKTPQEMQEMALKFNSMGSFSLLGALFKGGALNIDKVKKLLEQEFQDKTHDDCKTKFVSVATELNTGKEYHFKSGQLAQSVLASISIPGLFPGVKIDDNFYCDGGIVNNLPEDVARKLMPDAVVVSVDVMGSYPKQVETLKIKTIETILNACALVTINVIKNRPKYADVRLTIPVYKHSQMDFGAETTQKSIDKGELTAKKNLALIKKLLSGEEIDEPIKGNKRKSKK